MSAEGDKDNQAPNGSNGDRLESDQSPDCHNTYKAPTITDFQIVKPISRGAFGKVFLGHKNDKPDQMYAIKVMKKADMVHKNMVNQVIAERDALAVSKSPYIVRLFYSLQSDQNIYLVMEYMIGGDVKSLLGMYGYFDEDMAVRYIAEVVQALEYLHNHNIIHRDLKPDNMLISAKGHIKLTDFGLSKITLNRQIGIYDIVNTPCATKSQKLVNYFRTPGQVLSLTSSLAFTGKRGRNKSQLLSNSHYTGSWGRNTTMASPVNTTKDHVLASTPQFEKYTTPPPIKELTPTLQDSLTWRSSASGASLVAPKIIAMEKDACSVPQGEDALNDSVFTADKKGSESGSGKENQTPPNAPQCSGQSQKDAPGYRGGEKKRNADSTSSNDDDTPHLHRSRQSLQESYAHQHLRSMRKSTGNYSNNNPTPHSVLCERRFEKDFLQNASVSSIEVQRRQDVSCADSPMLANQISIHQPSPDDATSPGRKRPFTLIDRSPIRSFASTGSHTGMTMSFEAFAIGDEHLRKRHQEMSPVSPSARVARLRGMRSFKSRFGSGKPKKLKRFNPCTSSRYSSMGSNRDSLAYLASVSSLGSESDIAGIGAVLGMVPNVAGQCQAVTARVRTKSSSSCSDMDTSMGSPLQLKTNHQRSDSTSLASGKPLDLLSVSTSIQLDHSIQHSPISGNIMQPASCNTSMEVNLDTSMSSVETPVSMLDDHPADEPLLVTSSPRPQVTLNPGNIVSSSVPEHNISAVPTPVTPDAFINGKDIKPVTTLHNPFKTPSPVRQIMVSTPVNPRSSSQKPSSSSYDLYTSTSDGDSFCLERLFSSDSSILNDASNLDLDTSLHELSLKDKTHDSPSQHLMSPAEKKSDVSQVSTTTTLTPERVTHQTPKPGSDEGGKPRNKILRKVTTFMSMPASSCGSDDTSGGSMCTPVTKENLKRKNFLTPGLARKVQTPMRTPRSIHGRPCTYNDDNSNRILGTPDYLAPELLLQKEHTYAVDWWALGVCMYEFLTGIPPFNDASPDLVFQHILNRDLEWPDGEDEISANAKQTIEALLTPDPNSRPKAKDIRELPLFASMDWENLQNADMPFVPDPDNAMDTCYFDARNEMQHLQVSAIDL